MKNYINILLGILFTTLAPLGLATPHLYSPLQPRNDIPPISTVSIPLVGMQAPFGSDHGLRKRLIRRDIANLTLNGDSSMLALFVSFPLFFLFLIIYLLILSPHSIEFY